jgi:hypothetical protein
MSNETTARYLAHYRDGYSKYEPLNRLRQLEPKRGVMSVQRMTLAELTEDEQAEVDRIIEENKA